MISPKPIFVFGSNILGRHGAGAALEALNKHGAIEGQGKGLQGSSYAVPTKRSPYERMTHQEYTESIHEFLNFAQANQQLSFSFTPVGTGLAGFTKMELETIIQLWGELPETVFPTWRVK